MLYFNDVECLYEMIKLKRNLEVVEQHQVLHNKFEGKVILTHHCIKNKRLDAYMPEYKIEIEIDECNDEFWN